MNSGADFDDINLESAEVLDRGAAAGLAGLGRSSPGQSLFPGFSLVTLAPPGCPSSLGHLEDQCRMVGT